MLLWYDFVLDLLRQQELETYQLTDLVPAIGGYLGLFIGFSCIGFFDLLCNIFGIVCNEFNKWYNSFVHVQWTLYLWDDKVNLFSPLINKKIWQLDRNEKKLGSKKCHIIYSTKLVLSVIIKVRQNYIQFHISDIGVPC